MQRVFRGLLVNSARSAVVRHELSLVAVLVVIGACLAPAAASAATTFAVTDTTDAALTSSTGTSCASTDGGRCTLRAAIQAADNLGGDVTITLPVGTFPITIAPSMTADDPSTGDFDIDELNSATTFPIVTITGQGPDSTIINANSLDRAFTLASGSSLSLSGVSIKNGEALTTGPGAYDGGAIYALGSLSVSDSEFYDDAVGGEGGAIYAAAASVTDSTFTADVATTAGGGFATNGTGVVALINDTFDGNVTGNGTIGNGGAIAYVSNAPSSAGSEIVNSTIARNSASDGSGGIYFAEYAGKIENTIVADNTTAGIADNCGNSSNAVNDETGLVAGVDAGGNLDSDGSCFAGSTTGDKVNANPELGSLADNGGPTETDALLAGSAAIGEGLASACQPADQRGVRRVSGACDSGAYESQATKLSVSATGPTTAQAGQPFTEVFTVANAGPYPADAVVFSDALPAGATYVGISTSTGSSCTSGATLTCAIETMQPGTSVTVNVVLAGSIAGQLNNAAMASFQGVDLVGNSATASVTITGPPAPAPAPAPAAPSNTARPTITGTAIVNGFLDADPGIWSGGPTLEYQWYRCDGNGKDCAAIFAAVYANYNLAPGDLGDTFEVRVTATNSVGFATATSSPSAAIAAAPADVKASTTTTSGPTVLMTLGCADDDQFGCNVFVSLELLAALGARAGQEHPTMSTSAAYSSKLVLGSLRVKIKAGHKAKVRIKLNRTGRRLLAKKHRLKVVMTISQTGHKPLVRTIIFRTKPKEAGG
jgi:uncharacterized repeat protein (TIGR01451 family)